MDKTTALAMLSAIQSRGLACDLLLRYDAAANEVWSVEFDRTRPYTGADLSALANYCSQHGLTLTATFDQLGVI